MRVSSKVELSRERIDDNDAHFHKEFFFFSRLIFTSGQNLYCGAQNPSVIFFRFSQQRQVDESEFESGIVKREN